jgi:hypothetical protein
MSESIVEITTIEEKETKILTFTEATTTINEQYVLFFNELLEKFKHHEELLGPLNSDLKSINEKLLENNNHVIDIITDNFLFCLEQISDHNSDYFVYQKEKIPKKNGKFYKNKLPKIGNRTLLKRILKESGETKVCKNIIDFFVLLTYKNENDITIFNEDYIKYVKENFTENKNFSKMLMVIDNIDNILNAHDGDEIVNNDSQIAVVKEESNESKKKGKKNKKGKSDGIFGSGMNPDFLKGLENTKIAQLAKNISEKINIDDFPALSDPSKLLSSLGNSSEEGGIQNLLKFVVGEVEQAFKGDNLNEKDLVNEAQDIMGKFQNMSGFDPMAMLKNNNFDINQFADIFANMKK